MRTPPDTRRRGSFANVGEVMNSLSLLAWADVEMANADSDKCLHRARSHVFLHLTTIAARSGLIPLDATAAKAPLLTEVTSCSRSESLRHLRTNPQFVDVDGPVRALVITSAVPSEGKSTTAVNTAITFAQAEKRVLLIDADLRRPKIAEYLDIEGAVGLSNVLAGQVRFADVVQRWADTSCGCCLADRFRRTGIDPPVVSVLRPNSIPLSLAEAVACGLDQIAGAPGSVVAAKLMQRKLGVIAPNPAAVRSLRAAISLPEAISSACGNSAFAVIAAFRARRGPQWIGHCGPRASC